MGDHPYALPRTPRAKPRRSRLARLLHHCDVVSVNGPNYRLKNRLAAIERDTDMA